MVQFIWWLKCHKRILYICGRCLLRHLFYGLFYISYDGIRNTQMYVCAQLPKVFTTLSFKMTSDFFLRFWSSNLQKKYIKSNLNYHLEYVSAKSFKGIMETTCMYILLSVCKISSWNLFQLFSHFLSVISLYENIGIVLKFIFISSKIALSFTHLILITRWKEINNILNKKIQFTLILNE